jgi:hypothetical protein
MNVFFVLAIRREHVFCFRSLRPDLCFYLGQDSIVGIAISVVWTVRESDCSCCLLYSGYRISFLRGKLAGT